MGRVVESPGLHIPKPEYTPPPPPPRTNRPKLNTSQVYPRDFRIGVVISTFGTPAFVHLQLEARRRFAKDVPCLVVDDASGDATQLQALCTQYGADFVSNPARLGHIKGDLNALVQGLKWGRCDLLVKLSRRFLWLSPVWTTYLRTQAASWQHPTFGQHCNHYGFPLRSECFAVNVTLWSCHLAELQAAKVPGFLERYLFAVAQKVPCPPQFPDGEPVVAQFPLMTDDRHKRTEDFLWHDCTPPQEYQMVARGWGLTQYGVEDFEVKKD